MRDLKAASFDLYGTLLNFEGGLGTFCYAPADSFHTRVGELVER